MKPLILDCTLRDGGYVNNWEFDHETTKNIIDSLIDANIEIIECGFVNQLKGKKLDSSLFDNIETINKLLNETNAKKSNSQFVVMINLGEYDFSTLPECSKKNGVITGIRLAFHKRDINEAFEKSKIIIEKGYKLFVQGMVTLSYTDMELLQMIRQFNQLNMYALYIVDSFGAMFGDDFRRLHYLFENNLKKGVRLGYHSHNNLQLAYSNAIDFVQINAIDREIIIDSSIHGMGRGAGNLTTELLADYLNKKENTNYGIVPLLETIDKYLEVIYRENYWGYSIAHFLSASFGCHPNYSTYLVNKKTLSIVDMQKILSLLDNGQKKNFNKKRIEDLYIKFKSRDGLSINFTKDFFRDKKVLIIAPGPNAIKQKEKIKNFIQTLAPIVIAVNHVPKDFIVDYYFFSNQKRYEKFIDGIKPEKVIITTNIHEKPDSSNYKVVDFHDLVVMTSNKNDNVTILLLNLLQKQGVKSVSLAGLDGYKFSEENYNYQEFDRVFERKVLDKNNEEILKSLTEIRQNLAFEYLTDSIYTIKN